MTASSNLNPLQRTWRLGGLLLVLAAPSGVAAQGLTGPDMAKALRSGGYVLVMRHASSPRTPPSATEADAENLARERQLDETGRRTAVAMGRAIKALRTPIGQVWSSPTYRALETVRLAALPAPGTAPELGDGGQSMQASSGQQAAWLKTKAAERPASGTDTLIVTHFPNIDAAFGQSAAGLADGEALVFRPGGDGPPILVGRIKIEDWPKLAP